MPAVRARISWFFFFILLWLGATFVYFGDTGKHSDDYWFAGRMIEREGIDWSNQPWQSWPYFWRPLHLAHVWVMNTILWHHDWALHLELALVHAAVCVLLYRLLVRLGSTQGAAIAGVLLFGTCPLLGEAIGWSSASCNAISSLLMLITLDLARRFGSALAVQQSGGNSFAASNAPAQIFRGLLAIAITSFAAACFYEPAAAGLAAIPIVVWFACPPAAPRALRWRSTVLATIAGGLACTLYVALLLETAPSGRRGAVESIGGTQSLFDSFRKLAQSLRFLFFGPKGRDIYIGSIEQGLAAAWEHPVVLGIVIATSCAGLLVVLNGRRSRPQACPAKSELQDPAVAARGQLLLVGIVLLVVPWVPFIAQHAWDFELRSLYVPLIGAAFVVAAVGNRLCRWTATLTDRGRGVSGVIGTIAVGVLAIAGQVGLVGVQTQFRTNARQDAIVAAQLAAMSVHVEADTVFMILAAEHRGAATTHPAYNTVLHTALEAPWCAAAFIRRSMRREDVYVISGQYWARHALAIDHLMPKSYRQTGEGTEDHAAPWAKTVPLWIDAHAKIHVVESLTLKPLKGLPLELRLPRAERLALALPASLGSNPGLGDSDPKSVRLIETAHRRTYVIVETGPSTPAAGAARGTE